MPPPSQPLEAHIGLYIGYEDVVGQKASINRLNSLLSQLNLDEVLRVISTVNNLYSAEATRSGRETRAHQVGLARMLFSEDLLTKLLASPFGREPKTVLFHRQQQLYLLRHALMSCPHEGGMKWNEASAQLFGEACLVANGLLDSSGSRPGEPDEEDGLLDVIRMLLPLMEFGCDTEPISITGRAVQLWLSIPEEPELRAAANYIDIAGIFRAAYGVDLETFLKVLLVVYFQVLGAKASKDDAWTQFVIHLNSRLQQHEVPEGNSQESNGGIIVPAGRHGRHALQPAGPVAGQ